MWLNVSTMAITLRCKLLPESNNLGRVFELMLFKIALFSHKLYFTLFYTVEKFYISYVFSCFSLKTPCKIYCESMNGCISLT